MNDPTTNIHDDVSPFDDSQLEGCRALCDALQLSTICPKSKCRRASACGGHPGYCLRRHSKTVPQEVWDWVKENIQVNEEDLSDNEREEIEESIETCAGAYRGWIAGLAAGRAARR